MKTSSGWPICGSGSPPGRCGRGAAASPPPCPAVSASSELQRLTGLSPQAAQGRPSAASRRRGCSAGRNPPSNSRPRRRPSPLLDRDGFRRFLDRIPNHDRRVPVPRRILRLLAGGCRPALIATILGHLIRCLYVKGGSSRTVGRVKASWIAEHLRRRPAPRQGGAAGAHRHGMAHPPASPQWAINRWGALVRINLDWSRLEAATGRMRSDGPPPAPRPARNWHPLPPLPAPESAPPDSDEEPLQGDKNQEPAAGGPAGFSIAQPGEETPEAARLPRTPMPRCPPRRRCPRRVPPWNRGRTPLPGRSARRRGSPICATSCPRTSRTPGGCSSCTRRRSPLGLVPASEWGRLRFVAAAEHARVIGTANPVRAVRAAGAGRDAAFRDVRRRDGGERADQAAPVRGGGRGAGRRSRGGSSGAGRSSRRTPGWCRRCARRRRGRATGAMPSRC